MAKKIAWETISENDLRVDRDDDPFLDFPLLKLDDIHIVPKSELQVTTNSVSCLLYTSPSPRDPL